jgi:26S proteasome regulatory subunit N1
LQEGSDATIETLKIIEHPISKQAQILVDICSFAGTGNVLKVQTMLHHCDEHFEKPKTDEEKKEEDDEKKEEDKDKDAAAAEEKEPPKKQDDTFQAFAVIGIVLVAMGEDIGADMALRQLNHLVIFVFSPHSMSACSQLHQMHYGEQTIRKSVPLALGLLSASNPQLDIMDTLSKYSHDNDLQVALNSIFAMGLIGAGTNNARLAQMLRQLAGYYAKEPDCLFIVRIAQGLVHAGKGTVTINPFFHDRSIMSRTAVAGLLATLTAFTDAKACELP